jgi:hypothetical protein
VGLEEFLKLLSDLEKNPAPQVDHLLHLVPMASVQILLNLGAALLLDLTETVLHQVLLGQDLADSEQTLLNQEVQDLLSLANSAEVKAALPV